LRVQRRRSTRVRAVLGAVGGARAAHRIRVQVRGRCAAHRDRRALRDLSHPHQHAAGRAERGSAALGGITLVQHRRAEAVDGRDRPVGAPLRPRGHTSRDRARAHRDDRGRVLHRPRRSGLPDHLVRERVPHRPHVRPGHRPRGDGHPPHGLRAMDRRSCRTVAEEGSIGRSKMGARVIGAIGLALAMLVTACTSTTAGAGGAATATAAATAAAATATAVPKATCTAKKVTIAVPVTPPNVVHLTPYVAESFGYFKDENLTVELVRFDGGVGSLRASASGAINLAGTSSEPVLDAIANGADVKIVYSYAPNVDVSFAVGPGIKTLADLKGKKMGVQEPGGFADVMTRLVLKKAGIDPKDVTFVTTTTAGRVQALATGQTDTAVLHIDQVKTVQKQTPTITVLANMWEVLSDYQYAVYIVPTQTLKDDAATTECLIRALMRANRAMYDAANRDKIIQIGVEQTKEAKDVISDTFDLLVKAKAWPQNEGVPQANIDGTIKSERDFGKIKTDMKFADVTDLSIAKKVVDQLGRVKDFPY